MHTLRAVAGSSGGTRVTQLIAGSGISISPTAGTGAVTVSNSGIISIVVSANLQVTTSTAGVASLDVSSTVVLNTRSIIATSTTGSIAGGGNLSADRTLALVNDSVTPGNSKYYGTNSGGTKGFFDLPAAGVGTVTSIAAGTGLTTGSTAPITSSGTISLADTTVTADTYGTAASVARFTVDAQGRLTSATSIAIAITTSAITAGTFAISYIGLSASSGGVVYGTATAIGITAAGAAGQLLQSSGTAAPVWTTATYPATAGTVDRFLRSDGTNIVASTYALPNAIGALGTVLQSNGTNIVASAYTIPISIGAANTFLRSDGTNIVASTLVLPNTATTNTLLFTSATNTISTLATTATGALVTDASGVPSLTSGTTPSRVLRTDGTTVAFSQIDLSTDATGVLPVSSVPPDPFVQWLYMV